MAVLIFVVFSVHIYCLFVRLCVCTLTVGKALLPKLLLIVVNVDSCKQIRLFEMPRYQAP